MGDIKRVDVMTENPGICFNCGCSSEDGKPLGAVTFDGVDINWGDTPYLCENCVNVMADLFDRPSAEDFKELKTKLALLAGELRERRAAEAEVEEAQKKIREAGELVGANSDG